MKVSIVIPAFNEEKLLASSLQRIRQASRAFTARGWETELIVCNNNSTDRTEAVARAEGASVVFEPINQIARARNTGARAACGDWLIFIDADSHPSEALLAEVAEQIEQGDVLAGGATVRFEQARFAARFVCGLWNRLSRFKRWAAGSFIFCRGAAFREVGGFNEELFASEEIDLSKRLNELARRTGKQIVILHRHPITTSARKTTLYSNGEHLRFMFKTILGRGQTLRDRAACPIWYDGRR